MPDVLLMSGSSTNPALDTPSGSRGSGSAGVVSVVLVVSLPGSSPSAATSASSAAAAHRATAPTSSASTAAAISTGRRRDGAAPSPPSVESEPLSGGSVGGGPVSGPLVGVIVGRVASGGGVTAALSEANRSSTATTSPSSGRSAGALAIAERSTRSSSGECVDAASDVGHGVSFTRCMNVRGPSSSLRANGGCPSMSVHSVEANEYTSEAATVRASSKTSGGACSAVKAPIDALAPAPGRLEMPKSDSAGSP